MNEYSGHDEDQRDYHVAFRKYMYDKIQGDLDDLISYFKNSIGEVQMFNILRDEALELKEMLKTKEVYGTKENTRL